MRKVNKVIYLIITFFLGGLGIHKFYAGQTAAGWFYLLLSWTGIPALCAVYDFVVGIFKSSDSDGNITFD